MSLGCGPQAGNITSDNITARHLVNLKRVAFPKRDWLEIERRFHERAARSTGETAPRGSGMPGDPALSIGAELPRATSAPASASSPAATPERSSNWMGNPAFAPTFTDPGRAPSARRAPTPPRPSVAPASSASAPPATAVLPRPSAPARTAPARPQTTEVGQALSPADIQSIMQQAGTGCPLGPCKGCPHLEVRTGACKA
jgi:hypothetical protein